MTAARFFNLATPWCFHVQAPDIASMLFFGGGLASCHMGERNKHEFNEPLSSFLEATLKDPKHAGMCSGDLLHVA